MPELPEVETTLRGIQPHIQGRILSNTVVRNSQLRWPVPSAALKTLRGQRLERVERRAKYLLLHFSSGTILLHLGMSGSLRVLPVDQAVGKHDHIDLVFDQSLVRLNDPRRFGCCLLIQAPIEQHSLLAKLGPEPLSDEFDGEHLFVKSRGKSQAIKNFIMDGAVVVGVGNIYASESLFEAGIRPTMAARRVSRARYHLLAEKIKAVLARAIQAGGTTLNDFTQADGKPGYFRHELQVYGRANQPCFICGQKIKSKVVGQRNTFFCTQCQSF